MIVGWVVGGKAGNTKTWREMVGGWSTVFNLRLPVSINYREYVVFILIFIKLILETGATVTPVLMDFSV